MADARLPDRWLNDRRLNRLSDREFRCYVMALMYAVSNGTDGVIDREDIALIPHFDASVPEVLVKGGLWTAEGDHWIITDFLATQTTKAQLDAYRANQIKARDKKRRQRAEKKNPEDVVNTAVPGDVPGDRRWDGLGEARLGEARLGTTHLSNQRSLSNHSPLERISPDEEKNMSSPKSGTALGDDAAPLDVDVEELAEQEPLFCGLCGQPDPDPATGMHPKCAEVMRFRQRAHQRPPA